MPSERTKRKRQQHRPNTEVRVFVVLSGSELKRFEGVYLEYDRAWVRAHELLADEVVIMSCDVRQTTSSQEEVWRKRKIRSV